jgi:hypothetical protein
MGNTIVQEKLRGLVGILLGNSVKTPDGNEATPRLGKYGEIVALGLNAKPFSAVEEGSAFVAVTPTAGTGVALGIAAATQIVVTAPSLVIINNDAVGGKNVILDNIKLLVAAAGTAGTYQRFSIFTDAASSYTSGGTAFTVNNLNTGVGASSVVKGFDASVAIVAAATGAKKHIAEGVTRTAIPVIGDQLLVQFGGNVGNDSSITNGTAPLNLTTIVPQVVLAPQTGLFIWLWSASQSAAPTFEYAIQWIER